MTKNCTQQLKSGRAYVSITKNVSKVQKESQVVNNNKILGIKTFASFCIKIIIIMLFYYWIEKLRKGYWTVKKER